MWKDAQELERFFSADSKPRPTVKAREIVRQYKWADVTKSYAKAFGDL
jgi:hypothetical protein